MNQYRIYLKSELGKLGNSGNAKWFLQTIPEQSLTRYGLPVVVKQLTERFASQEEVNSFVDSLSDADLASLTKTCDHEWRKNGVFDKLHRHSVWREDTVPVERIDVQQAEEHLAWLFERNGFQLTRVTKDSELWKHKPYAEWKADAPVHFPVALGRLRSGRWKLFDGIHRAIKLVQMGKESIHVCFCED